MNYVDENILEQIYKERLEERIISNISERFNLGYLDATDLYYNSRLSGLIHAGSYGIQYLDFKVLVDMMVDTEPDLIKSRTTPK